MADGQVENKIRATARVDDSSGQSSARWAPIARVSVWLDAMFDQRWQVKTEALDEHGRGTGEVGSTFLILVHIHTFIKTRFSFRTFIHSSFHIPLSTFRAFLFELSARKVKSGGAGQRDAGLGGRCERHDAVVAAVAPVERGRVQPGSASDLRRGRICRPSEHRGPSRRSIRRGGLIENIRRIELLCSLSSIRHKYCILSPSHQ